VACYSTYGHDLVRVFWEESRGIALMVMMILGTEMAPRSVVAFQTVEPLEDSEVMDDAGVLV
jgi:hypothetical protein